ncbi:MAG: MarR family transcriptional regulator [Deltaproteobacteria bacterium]|nr:MarR family transcriptional regulator [Deltaproteobacteria bacterium]
MTEKEARERFIDSWGTMGALWGINASVARVHALLLLTDGPLSLDEIARHLAISRGNASMSLKELKTWGIIRLVKAPGDRQDYYVTEPDAWRIFFLIARGRKRREFDPLLGVVNETLTAMPKGAGAVPGRIRQLQDLLQTLDWLGEAALANEDRCRTALAMMSKLLGAKKKG